MPHVPCLHAHFPCRYRQLSSPFGSLSVYMEIKEATWKKGNKPMLLIPYRTGYYVSDMGETGTLDFKFRSGKNTGAYWRLPDFPANLGREDDTDDFVRYVSLPWITDKFPNPSDLHLRRPCLVSGDSRLSRPGYPLLQWWMNEWWSALNPEHLNDLTVLVVWYYFFCACASPIS